MASTRASTIVLFDQDTAPDAVPATDGRASATARTCVTLQRVRLWSVARTAIVFWCCVGAVVADLVLVLWAFLAWTGTISNFQSFVVDVTGVKEFHLVPGTVLASVALVVLLGTIVSIALTVAAAAFYNAIAALTGGVRVDCIPREATMEGSFASIDSP